MTAGHCVVGDDGKIFNPEMEQVVTRKKEIYDIKNIYLKPGFYFQTIPNTQATLAENDIAIIELSTPIINESQVKLPNPEQYADYYKEENIVVALGYGNFDLTNTPSYPLLRSATLSIVPLIWHDVPGFSFSAANQYLYPAAFVGAYNQSQGATSHDSGSPLLFKDSTGDYIIIGTTSSSVNICSKASDSGKINCTFQPVAYTKTDAPDNIAWINQIVANITK